MRSARVARCRGSRAQCAAAGQSRERAAKAGEANSGFADAAGRSQFRFGAFQPPAPPGAASAFDVGEARHRAIARGKTPESQFPVGRLG
ncbi:MAG TPA: hypothetical protein VGZ73_02690 [Bryobacteraceae bacterium]|nr:hypothetical protein [Bryobacteraceae bacterium]